MASVMAAIKTSFGQVKDPDFSFELRLWSGGMRLVAGLDEAGRGALAGPVAAGVVIFEAEKVDVRDLKGVRDSKQMTPGERARWAVGIRQMAQGWGVGFASNEEIDEFGIVPATRLAMLRALEKLPASPEHLLIDYIQIPECPIPQTAIIKGDARVMSIAAASVLAKTGRDELLCEYDQKYPGYGFARHKGYGTAAHLQALERLGPCEMHRSSFAPVRDYLVKEGNDGAR
jgi:ribonuclease HII